MRNTHCICCSGNSSTDRNSEKQIPFSRPVNFSCENSVTGLWTESGATTDPNLPVLLFFSSLKNKASEENIFLSQKFIANCAEAAGFKWHIQASFCSCTLQMGRSSYASAHFCPRSCCYGYKVGGLSHSLHIISYWWAMRCRRLSKSLGNFRLKYIETEELCA